MSIDTSFATSNFYCTYLNCNGSLAEQTKDIYSHANHKKEELYLAKSTLWLIDAIATSIDAIVNTFLFLVRLVASSAYTFFASIDILFQGSPTDEVKFFKKRYFLGCYSKN